MTCRVFYARQLFRLMLTASVCCKLHSTVRLDSKWKFVANKMHFSFFSSEMTFLLLMSQCVKPFMGQWSFFRGITGRDRHSCRKCGTVYEGSLVLYTQDQQPKRPIDSDSRKLNYAPIQDLHNDNKNRGYISKLLHYITWHYITRCNVICLPT